MRWPNAHNPSRRRVITTPMLLLTLLLGTGLPLSHIFFTIFMDEVMIVTGLVGALVQSSYKWGYFTLGCVAMLCAYLFTAERPKARTDRSHDDVDVFWVLVFPARQAAKFIGDDNHSAYVRGALMLSFLWFLYPIAWGLADGGNVISTDGEMIFYGVLDVSTAALRTDETESDDFSESSVSRLQRAASGRAL